MQNNELSQLRKKCYDLGRIVNINIPEYKYLNYLNSLNEWDLRHHLKTIKQKLKIINN
jgi:hypothetical protein